jgi:hypothetical protein
MSMTHEAIRMLVEMLVFFTAMRLDPVALKYPTGMLKVGKVLTLTVANEMGVALTRLPLIQTLNRSSADP